MYTKLCRLEVNYFLSSCGSGGLDFGNLSLAPFWLLLVIYEYGIGSYYKIIYNFWIRMCFCLTVAPLHQAVIIKTVAHISLFLFGLILWSCYFFELHAWNSVW
jgi:hypothetical protein